MNCYDVCKCDNLFPQKKLWTSCAILLAVAGVQRCVNRRELDAGILTINGSEIMTVSIAPRSDWATCGIQVIVDGAVECLKNRDELEEFDLTIDYSILPDDIVVDYDLVKREDLAKRHNFAFVCYTFNPTVFPDAVISTDTGRDCLSLNYNCDSQGKITHTGPVSSAVWV